MIGEGQAQVDAILARFDSASSGSKQKRQRTSGTSSGGAYDGTVWSTKLSDDEVLALARRAKNGAKFAVLFDDGNLNDYEGDHSRGDAALIGMLAFYTGPSPQQLDQIFRRSALMRDKWDESRGDSTYGELTIGEVLRKCGADRNKYYQSPTKSQGNQDPRGIKGEDLLRKRFEPVRWIVDRYLPEGLTICAGAPKIGKSWLFLAIALGVSLGDPVLDQIIGRPGDVLYLALEDNERRLKSRLLKLWDTEDTTPDLFADPEPLDPDFVIDFSKMRLPDRLTFWTDCPTLDKGGLAHIEKWLTDHPEAALVVIDTLAKMRPVRAKGGNAYDEDYAALTGLQRLAAKHGVAIVVIHHLRKAASDDPLERISGTMGISGAADSLWVLQRSRGGEDATLFVTGRDIEDESNLAVRFESKRAQWIVLGQAEEVQRSKEQQEVIDVLKAAREPMTPSQVADELGQPRNRIRQRMLYMWKRGVLQNNNGKYSYA